MYLELVNTKHAVQRASERKLELPRAISVDRVFDVHYLGGRVNEFKVEIDNRQVLVLSPRRKNLAAIVTTYKKD